MTPTSFNAPSPEAMNRLLPAFEFSALIASDEFSAVYLANQRSLDRQVAVKVIAPDAGKNPTFRGGVESTARAMAQLNHPNLIRIYDSGTVEEMFYFVMEFVPGKSLAHSTKGKPVELNQAILLVEAICQGLAHAHSHQIIHGDLNPSHILLNQKAQPKIGNFGFTHPSARESSRFIAPELLSAQSPPTVQSDVFAIGALLYELITGQHHGPEAPPLSNLATCSPQIDAIWRHATATDPSQRMPDVKSFQTALKAATGNRAAPDRPTPSPPDQPSTPPSHKVGFNWKLVRNLCIIAGLLYAINIAWKNLENTRLQRDRENRELLAKQTAEKENARAEALARAKSPPTPKPAADPSGLPKPVVPEVPETPQESLARLRQDLASGSRSEMPVSALRKGEHDYFLVSEPMSWPDAVWFAERHGAHLAIPNTTADLTWLVNEVATGQGVWIGAARSDRNSWALADGSPWKPAKQPTGIGQYLATDKHGFLRAEGVQARHPFIIQWHRDGTNPGTLDALLASTRNTITRPEPTFPPGTRAFGVRHYLFVSRPLTWRQAVDLAEKSGGHLAVPSGIAETVNLEEMTNDIAAQNGIWLGGFLKGDHWLWITGEPWKTAKWTQSAATTTPGSALIIRPAEGWDAQDLSETASGFIIEWSNDRKSAPAPQIVAPASQGDASALVAHARKLITAAEQQRKKQLALNADKLTWDLDLFIRALPKSQHHIWSPHAERLKASIKDHRVPSSIPESSGIRLSPQMAKLTRYHAQKQNTIDTEFITGAEKIRVAFSAKLRESQAQAQASGQPKLAQSIADMLTQASDLETWARSFGIEARPENPVPESLPETLPESPSEPGPQPPNAGVRIK